MKWLLLVLGIGTMLLGVLRWPMGVGESGWFRVTMFDEYREALGDRWTPEDPVPGQLVRRFEPYLFSECVQEMLFLLVTGAIQTVVAGHLIRQIPPREAA